MLRRIGIAALWFVSSWMTYGLIAYFLGLPDGGGAIVGSLLGAFVFMDPTGLLWARSNLASTEPMPAQPTQQTDVVASAR